MTLRLKFKHKILLNIISGCLFVGFSIMLATYLLSDSGKVTVLEGVTERLTDLQEITERELNKAQEIASEGVIEASGVPAIEKVTDITLDQQKKYIELVQEEIALVAENVTESLRKQNKTTNDTLNNLLSVSTDSMNRIMEFDNASLNVLSTMAVFNVNNFTTISAEGLKRLNSNMGVIDSLLWKMQEDSLDDIDTLWSEVFVLYGPYDTVLKKQNIKKLEDEFDALRKNIEVRQRDLFKTFQQEFTMQSLIIAEEMRLLTDKVNIAINNEIENSTIIQDENIERVITDLLLEKIKISDNIAGSASQVKKTLNSLESRLLTILQEKGEGTRKNIASQTSETRMATEKTKQRVSREIQENTLGALAKIDETIKDSNRVIEEVLEQSSQKTIAYGMLITVLCTVVAVYFSFIMVKSVTNPVSNVMEFAAKISKGNLQERLPEGPDEMGEMGGALNKMAEDLLNLQEATLNSFNQTLDQVIDCVFVFNPETLNFIYVNQGAMLQVEYTREELQSMTPLDIKPEYTKDSFEDLIAPLKSEKQESQIFTTVHRSKSGKDIPVEVFLKYVVPPGNEPRFIAIVRDITERERAKEEKEAIQTQLLHAQKLESVGQLAAGIAHEINTPTQFIGTNIEFFSDIYQDIKSLIEGMEGLKSGASHEMVQEIDKLIEECDWEYIAQELPVAIRQAREGVDRVTSIVGAMKNFSHPGSKEMEENNINHIIENTITVASNEWKYVAEMKKDLDPDLPVVPCLADEMGQVLLNLLVNAVHAIKKGKVGENDEITGEISICSKPEGDNILITIADNGCGIPKDVQPRIFDPFFTTKEVGKGTGQGLAISHDVVTQKHNGGLTFESEVGKGSIFYVRLPVSG